MDIQEDQQVHGFQTEVKQLLHLVVHSLYSNKEIFLRELVSNASDAADKLRFAALSDNNLYDGDADLKIRVDFNKDNRTITVSDNGVGMTREEVMDNLGTIAKSGTREFLSQLSGDQAKDSNLIGQFGVGFYSAFIIADSVTVRTRKAGTDSNQAVMWQSKGEGDYTLKTTSKSSRGTEITLHLKEGEDEFLDDMRLRGIITKYSDHISWPIVMTKTVEAEDDSKETTVEDETVNRATALWTMSKSEVKDEEYQELYKHISHDFENPLTWTHNHVEGKQQYTTLLYVPSRAPFDMWNQEFKHGLRLYVKRVFIMDDADRFLPRYLRFVKGIVDSADLPLNVSREILQDNKLVDNIRSAVIKRTLSTLEKMAENDKENYAKFYKEFGLVLKEGPIEDFANRERIAALLRFSTSKDDNETASVSLDEYIERMPEGQDKIYYVTADSFNSAKSSPHLEIFRKKGIEVVLLHDRIDEWLVSHMSEYKGKHMQSITRGELDLGDMEDEAEKEAQKKTEETLTPFIEHMAKVLEAQVKEVRITHRLTASPACVVADTHDMGREMQRLMQAAGQAMPDSKPIFEINPTHALIKRLEAETDDERFADWSNILFDQAILAEGGQLDDPAQFVRRLNNMLLELAG